MNTFNLVISGNVGGAPEFKYTETGVAICSFSLAHSPRKGETQWFRVTAWRELAETCNQYIKTGMRVMVVARREDCSTWTSKKTGEVQVTRELTAISVEFAGSPTKQDATESEDDEPAF